MTDLNHEIKTDLLAIVAKIDAAAPAHPAPEPDPDPGPVDPAPAPIPNPPATPNPPVPVDLRAFINSLRDKGMTGVGDRSRLKVAGQDPLPKGATLTPTTVRLTGGVTLDGWDLGGRGLHFAGRASASNILSLGIRGPKAGGPLYGIEIDPDGEIEHAEFLELAGTFGTTVGHSKALAAQERGTGAGFTAGKVRVLRRSRLEGFQQDHLYTYGVPGGVELITENFFGPQWGFSGQEHADVFTMGGALGCVHHRRNLIDWTGAGKPFGINNIWRKVRNKASFAPVEWMLIEENVAYYVANQKAFPIQINSGGKANWGTNGQKPRFDYVRNWLTPNAAGQLFYDGSEPEVTTWDGNVHAKTGAALALD